jgi:serine O-acetyltransferase
MGIKEYVFLVRSDLYRYSGKATGALFVRQYLTNPGFKYSFWMRTCRYLQGSATGRWGLSGLSGLVLKHYAYKFGMSIPFQTEIGSGFYIGHFGGIIVNERAVIGKNCNISPGVIVGQANRGRNKGYPTLGDNVYLGPGAKLVGNVRVGSNVAIGANCVVTRDVPDNAVVVGIPGRVISFKGSERYVDHTDYRELEGRATRSERI